MIETAGASARRDFAECGSSDDAIGGCGAFTCRSSGIVTGSRREFPAEKPERLVGRGGSSSNTAEHRRRPRHGQAPATAAAAVESDRVRRKYRAHGRDRYRTTPLLSTKPESRSYAPALFHLERGGDVQKLIALQPDQLPSQLPPHQKP